MITNMSYEDRVRADKEYLELCALAVELAKKTESRKAVLELIHYPAWASPPPEPLRQYMRWAADMRKKAAEILRERKAHSAESPLYTPGLVNRRPIIVDKNRESLSRLREKFPEESTGMAEKHRKQTPISRIAAAMCLTFSLFSISTISVAIALHLVALQSYEN